MVRSVLEYASPIFANLSKYLADAIEAIQKRALRIIFPHISYSQALEKSSLKTLKGRRDDACVKFIKNIGASNPVYSLIFSRIILPSELYPRREDKPTMYLKSAATERFSGLLTHKYAQELKLRDGEGGRAKGGEGG